MVNLCPECGATVPNGGSCRDNFNALLLLEWQIPGGPGELGHFLAVATYGLQHPDSMNYTAQALAGLYAAVGDVIGVRVTLDQLRLRTRHATNGLTRITRRKGDTEVEWRRGIWTMTVADVLTVEAETIAYAERVTHWAHATVETLDLSPSLAVG